MKLEEGPRAGVIAPTEALLSWVEKQCNGRQNQSSGKYFTAALKTRRGSLDF